MVANVFQDRYRLGDSYLPSVYDIGKPLLVLTSRGALRTRFRGLMGCIPFNPPMYDLLITDAVVEGGDSGACLVDLQMSVWGTVVGSATIEGRYCSAFMSINTLLVNEQARLA